MTPSGNKAGHLCSPSFASSISVMVSLSATAVFFWALAFPQLDRRGSDEAVRAPMPSVPLFYHSTQSLGVNLALLELMCYPALGIHTHVLCQHPTLFLHYWLINRASSMKLGLKGRKRWPAECKAAECAESDTPLLLKHQAWHDRTSALVAINRFFYTNLPANILCGRNWLTMSGCVAT